MKLLFNGPLYLVPDDDDIEIIDPDENDDWEPYPVESEDD